MVGPYLRQFEQLKNVPKNVLKNKVVFSSIFFKKNCYCIL
ncbi:unnamed protein product [Acanthoscelides obtectus]|uniref:Uncharacterized protein n=1 Tax=Acanthoscelides obtectus TaxID=200917 RepID=A0A9P0LLV9_ACAOB|nr:unnamed protein product [Acanthoscelides obtectus]CAK1660792.1 hypothetical protein AOBTE_LOCUS22267 [Acanthoscelides obtectus]